MPARHPVSLAAVGTLAALGTLLGACPGATDAPADDAGLIVGVQADDFGALVDAVRIVTTVDGKPFSDETVAVGPATPSTLPKEVALRGPAGARAVVVVSGTTAAAPNGPTPTGG
jgi:hypothetical protein